ncbi:hypothetical protein [Diatraea saccharalis granulovirus]|uniref:Uncharacterized protein n=1 Tax=Diatraea saccharalis granulovirus TaxID=1675862 RepID=A0A0R7EZ09_9BBAC|nr:hypothetical protein [Diatraea saccharalis granulovirus]AKN80825.1 hypothetical protein [Diatraea saccharalis granulovirus]
MLSSDSIDKLEIITDADVTLANQYTYNGPEDGMYSYTNNINKNNTYFSKKLVNLHDLNRYYLYTD